jgi:hypothetical protein
VYDFIKTAYLAFKSAVFHLLIKIENDFAEKEGFMNRRRKIWGRY